MEDTFSSLLCRTWIWDPNHWCAIKFKADGTGELTCRVEFNLYVAAEFDWKPQPSSQALDSVINPDTNQALLAEYNLELTLTKRRIPSLGNTSTEGAQINEAHLTDAAFVPKTYTIRLEKGRFPVSRNVSVWANWWYGLRIVFDKSPFPPLEEWQGKATSTVEGNKFYDRVDFYDQELEVTERED
ncbi:hypothetical protein F4775DRAFT_554264 [Biscogniauxia sp. FL1348]|nr:hypothetical protein F4775DRAFT_554264 [Biscogniauxia sp. FL1348]